jgi:hypothetical protein
MASTSDPWKGSPGSDVPGNVIAKPSDAASARSIDRNEAAIAHKGPGAGVKNHDSLQVDFGMTFPRRFGEKGGCCLRIYQLGPKILHNFAFENL